MKNIVLCADGTGNKGGYTPDSNVYKIYQAVKLHDPVDAQSNPVEQITFYDNGVGTSENKMWRALSGAFGFGIRQNVCDLYTFLARNYNPEDKHHADGESQESSGNTGDAVFMFGFSRGAATIRALTGLIYVCGLIDGRQLSTKHLDEKVDNAFNAYKRAGRNNTAPADSIRKVNHGRIPIKFVGVWDTVAALGFPRRTDKTGPVSWTLNKLFPVLDWLLDRIWPHRFYKYDLTTNIENAYHALALDDARTSFWPLVWDETNILGAEEEGDTPTVEQVWFAGMHSNVGGGYERAEMATVTLDWMMTRAENPALNPGLIFKERDREEAHANKNVHGRLYDSRDGFAMFYRYHPREVQFLCQTKLQGEIKIHESVIQRMKAKTANYAPVDLPGKFAVASALGHPMNVIDPEFEPEWHVKRRDVGKIVLQRKRLYMAFLTASLSIVGSAIWFWMNPPEQWGASGVFRHAADGLHYILPDLFSGLIEIAVLQHPEYFVAACVTAGVGRWYRKSLRRRTVAAAERLREIVLRRVEEVTSRA